VALGVAIDVALGESALDAGPGDAETAAELSGALDAGADDGELAPA
jgi:hypothetical protein